MRVVDKDDDWLRRLKDRYLKKFQSCSLLKDKVEIYLSHFISDCTGSKHLYIHIKFYNIDDTDYQFDHDFDYNIDEEDFKIELDKVMRKWYKIINEIITRIECYEIEEKDYDKL